MDLQQVAARIRKLRWFDGVVEKQVRHLMATEAQGRALVAESHPHTTTAPLQRSSCEQQVILEPKPDRRRTVERWVTQKTSGRWAILSSRGNPPTGSYGSEANAIKAVLKRRAARAQLLEARRAGKEACDAVRAAKDAMRAKKVRERKEAFAVKLAAQAARGIAQAKKLNETFERQRRLRRDWKARIALRKSKNDQES